jgi:glyoxylase-like metal-dependent hydrolase (beta-lactamase superfamily II)
MLKRPTMILLIFIPSILFVSAQELRNPAASQAPLAGQAANSGSLRQIIPNHYVYSTTNAGRVFSSGIIVTSDGALVVDALDSEAIARAERESISSIIRQPVRYLVSSSFHDPFSKGNIAYADVFKIGHENYRAGLLDQMKRGGASAEEQLARLPNETFRDRVTFNFGGKEIQVLYFGRAHTLGDSVIFVPQDRIAYLSEVFFAEEFPNMAQGYGVSWLRVLDAVETLEADIFVPGHGPIPEDPRGTRAGLHRMRQILIDARDAIQNEIARGATEDQAVAAVKLQQYEKLPTYAAQREVTVRRMYKELTGSLP